MKDNSEIIIPNDAIEILDKILILTSLWEDYEEPEISTTAYRELHKEDLYETLPFELVDLLDTLPYRWCKVDPFKKSCFLKFESNELTLLFLPNSNFSNAPTPMILWESEEALPSFACFYNVPKLLLSALYQFVTKEFALPSKETLGIHNDLIKLRKYLKVRFDVFKESALQPDKTTSLESDSRTKVQAPIEISSIPNLTNHGRTIISISGEFTFTKDQAPIIQIYWENYENGNEFLAGQEALERAGRPETTFDSLFKSRRVEFKTVFERHESERDLLRLKLD